MSDRDEHIWDDTRVGDHREVGCRKCGNNPCPVHEPMMYARWREKRGLPPEPAFRPPTK